MSLRQESSSYEASDESSENELLDRSLSLWRGWVALDDDDTNNNDEDDDFAPFPLDLHTASSIGHYECVRTIIARKDVDINGCNKGGWTPLMYASYIGHEDILNLLLKSDANVNITNHKGQTALMLAASCGNERISQCLCQNRAELEGQDYRGWTALFHATYAGHHNMVKFLLERNANLNARDPRTGFTPFMEAAAGGHEIIVQLFLQRGVSLNVKTYSGDTAQSLALMNGHMNIVNLINQYMAARDKDPNLTEDSSVFFTAHRPVHHPIIGRPIRNKMTRGPPDIRDGPDAFARLIERSKSTELLFPNSYIPDGYMTFTQANEEREDTHLRYRDVTSPINPQDHNLDSSGSKDSYEAEDESTVFSRTGALTIRSSSSSSGGLAAALGLSPDNGGGGGGGDVLVPSLIEILPKDFHLTNSSRLREDNEFSFSTEDNSQLNALDIARLDINSPSNFEAKYVLADRGYSSDPCRSTWGMSACDPQITTNEGFPIFSGNQFSPFVNGKTSPFQLPLPDNQDDYNPLMSDLYSFKDMDPNSEQGFSPMPYLLRNSMFDPYKKTCNFLLESSSSSPDQNQTNSCVIPDLKKEKSFLYKKSESKHFACFSSSTNFPIENQKSKNTYFSLENQSSNFDAFAQTTSSPKSLLCNNPIVNKEPPSSSPCDPASSPILSPNSPNLDLANGILSSCAINSNSNKPETLAELLLQLGLLKYQKIFEEQDVDLQVFLSLTDNDLKEIGIKLFGPRRKMTSAIARWHSDVRSPSDGLERAYADRLEAEMQEMAIQLHQANSQVKTLKAQVLQEQNLRSVTEGCFMEERALRQTERCQLEDLAQRCEQTLQILDQIRHFHTDFRDCLLISNSNPRDQQEEDILKNNVNQLIKKLELCFNDVQQTLDFILKTIERLLQENSSSPYLSPTFQ